VVQKMLRIAAAAPVETPKSNILYNKNLRPA